MIYYFSGTGNSRTVAYCLGKLLECDVADMSATQQIPDLGFTKSLGLVFPVYAWGLPDIVERFVCRLQLLAEDTYVWAVMTCGDDMGYADAILDKCLHRVSGVHVQAVYSVPMPNTYVCLPGFDVDAPEVASAKVEHTRNVLPTIARSIRLQAKECNVVRGACPWLKTYVLRPLFNRFLLTDRYFYADSRLCTRCGLCVKQCPTNNIRLSENGVQWGNSKCVGCLGCYHSCPHRAIEWGSATRGKGQKQTKNLF